MHVNEAEHFANKVTSRDIKKYCSKDDDLLVGQGFPRALLSHGILVGDFKVCVCASTLPPQTFVLEYYIFLVHDLKVFWSCIY